MAMQPRTRLAWPFVALATLAVACSPDAQNPVAPTDRPAYDEGHVDGPGIGINVCKIAQDNETIGVPFTFTTSATGGTVNTPVTLTATLLGDPDPSACATVWTSTASFDNTSQVTITEEVPAGFKLELVVFTTAPGDPKIATLDPPTSNSVTVTPNHGMTIFFKNMKVDVPPPPPPPGGQGCTPGFWKQSQHFAHWTGYATTDVYNTVFGVGPSITLLQALGSGGGGENALLRHSVAALLNSTSDGVAYDMTTAQVIAAVQNAYASGDFETAKNTFEGFNEQGCMLRRLK